jgi:hypothetical protein
MGLHCRRNAEWQNDTRTPNPANRLFFREGYGADVNATGNPAELELYDSTRAKSRSDNWGYLFSHPAQRRTLQ